MPRYRSQYRIVSLSGKDDGNFVPLENYISLPPNKEPVDLGSVAAFKSSELLSQHGIEGISDHGHDDIKVHLDQDGGRKGVEVEKLDGLRNYVFYPPPSGIIADKQLRWRVEVIGNKKSGLLTAVSPKDQLPQITPIFFHRYKRFMDQRIGILPFGVGNMNALPGLNCLGSLQHVFAPASEGDKAYPLLIKRREPGVSGKLGVEHKSRFDPALDLFPEGKKTDHRSPIQGF